MNAGDGGTPAAEAAIMVTNEYAHVKIRKVYTRNGERLEISAPLAGAEVRLDAVILELLARMTPEAASRLLAAEEMR